VTAQVRFSVNQATYEEIKDHLHQCSLSFRPALESRVDISEYSKKIIARANRFEAWKETRLAGLIAIYSNLADCTAYITNVSVVPDFQGLKIAESLLTQAFSFFTASHCKTVELEVGADNIKAVQLYKKFGFQEKSQLTSSYIMVKQMGNYIERL